MLSNAMWRAQVALHGQGNNAMLPALLVGASSIMVVYKHFTDEQYGDPIKHFLCLIVIQMLPLVFLQMKILACPDPIGMLSRFGTKVLLMHACFLALRICAWPMMEINNGFLNVLAFVLVCVALHWGFKFRCMSILSHLDIGCLVLLAGAGALGTSLLDFYTNPNLASLLEHSIFTASSYIEILAFVPGVWMVYQSVKKNDDECISEAGNVQTQATFFFAFLVPFYIMEDIVSAYRVGGLAAIGHIVHFLVLLDFACFLLSHVHNPDKVPGSLFRWLPGQLCMTV